MQPAAEIELKRVTSSLLLRHPPPSELQRNTWSNGALREEFPTRASWQQVQSHSSASSVCSSKREAFQISLNASEMRAQL